MRAGTGNGGFGGVCDQFEGRCHDRFTLLTREAVFKLCVMFYNYHIYNLVHRETGGQAARNQLWHNI